MAQWVENATPEVEAQSQYVTIITICIVFSVLSVTIVSMRLWVRQSARGLAADDILAALSMVFALVYSILCILQTKYGLGLPIALRPKADLIPYTRLNFAGRPFYQLGISFFKIALLISYLRLFKGTNEVVYRRIVWVSIVAIFLGHLGSTLSLIFACRPVHKSWEPLVDGTCLPSGPSFTGYAIVTIVSDVVVTVLPIPVLLKLNVSKNKKIGLIFIFLLGILTTICSILRYLQINRIQFGDGNSTMLILFGTIEFNVGNMVSSLPFLAPVFVRKAREYRSKMSKGSGGYGSASDGPNNSDHRTPRGKTGEMYKLGSRGGDGSSGGSKAGGYSAKVTETDPNSSEEFVLQGSYGDHNILKSVSYSVRVDEETGRAGSKAGFRRS